MSLTTPLCKTLGISVPLVQAPIGSAATPELVSAVSSAGALGMLALTWVDAARARDLIRQTQRLTSAPFGVNLSLDFPIDRQLDTALDLGVRIISTFWGDPARVRDRINAAGCTHLHTVRSPQEARAAVDVGVDVIVAQGWEAGGHVWGEVATLPLVPAVVDAVDPHPVIAAGGIADGRGLAAVLMLGAQAAWLGTRFVAAAEADTHAVYRELVMAAAVSDAVMTSCFDGGWPNAPHRVLRNSTLTAWADAGSAPPPHRPGEGDVIAQGSDPPTRFHRYDDMMPLGSLTGQLEAMALYAGQSAGLVRDVAPAAQIIGEIADVAEQTLRKGASLVSPRK